MTIPAGDAATATITNTYQPAPASLTVTKTITGPAAGQHGTVHIVVDCGPVTETLTVPAGAPPSPPLVMTGLVAPTTCTVSEPLNGATTTVQVTTTGLGPLTLNPGDALAVTVTDVYEQRPATLLLTKAITGDGAGQQGPIAITADCSDGTTATFPLAAGASSTAPFTVSGLPAGTSCTIDEPADGATPAVAVSTSPVLPVTVGPLTAGATGALTITNEYTLLTGRLVVAKEVSGDASQFRGPITLALGCSDGTTGSVTYPPRAPLTALEIGPCGSGRCARSPNRPLAPSLTSWRPTRSSTPARRSSSTNQPKSSRSTTATPSRPAPWRWSNRSTVPPPASGARSESSSPAATRSPPSTAPPARPDQHVSS